MNIQTRRKLLKAVSRVANIAVIITMVVNNILIAMQAQAAPVTTPRFSDYTENLLVVSNTLELDDTGNLNFPHPEARPGSAKGTVLPYKEFADTTLTSEFLPDFSQNTQFQSGQSSRSRGTPFRQSGPTFPALEMSPFAADTPLQLTISNYSGILPLQQQNVISDVYLPIVFGSGPNTNPVVIGEKAIFNQILPDTAQLSTALGFSAVQIGQIQSIIDAENAAIALLEAEAAAIINDDTKTLAEKKAAIIAINYNERLKSILRDSQTQLRNQLGDIAYQQLYDWLEQQWQLFKAQRNAIRSTSGALGLSLAGKAVQISASSTPSETCQVFDVFATRSTYTDYSADLPDQYVKKANRGWEYSEGYTDTVVYSITVKYNNKVAKNVVITDVAPWNHNDNYWNTITDTTHPRRIFTDLEQGMPEAEAAYFDGYNGGKSEFGILVTNPGGLNVSQQTADFIGMGGSAWVEVTFPWGCVPDETLTQSRLEQSWGVNDWSQSTAHLVNPVTGNQSNWFRDLYIPAPGLDVDIVRYYNSQDGEDGIFGRGWSSQIDMRVYPQPDGTYKIRYQDGRRALFYPDGSGGFVGGVGAFDTFALAGGNFVLTGTDQLIYNFNNNGRLENINDLVGNQIVLVYSGDNPTKITDSVGREINLTFDGNGHATQMVDFDGRTVTYSYGALGATARILGATAQGDISASAAVQSAPLISVTDPNGGISTYEYDPSTQALTQAKDAEGIVFLQNSYDAEGRVINQASSSGVSSGNIQAASSQNKTTFNYDPQNRRSTSTDKLGNTTTYVYDKKFRLIQEIDALDHSIHYKYDNNDNMNEKTDKRGFTWYFEYDDRGNMTKRTDPISGYSAVYYGSDITTWEYNERNHAVKMTNALGEVTQYEYDDKGNRTKIIEANGATSVSVFDAKGQMISMTDAEGRTTTFEYDSKGNRTKITDPLGGVTTMTYDDSGHVTSRTDAEGRTTTYEYDKNGNVTKITDPLGKETRREYDKNNNVIKQTDRRGAVTEFKYDNDLNLIESKDPVGNIAGYEYDAMGNRTKIIDARGNSTILEYDAMYRVIKITDIGGNATRNEYDENGNLTKTIDPLGGETRIVYDAVNRRKYVYDQLNHQTEFCYDALDRVIRIFDPRRALTRYEYDTVSNFKRSIDPLGAVTELGYDLVRNNIWVKDPNGNVSHSTYDDLNRPIAQIDSLGNTWQTGYDRVSNITSITDTKGNVSTSEYDVNDRLTKTTNPLGKSATFTYDADDNQISATDEKGNTTTTVYDLNGRPQSVTDALGYTTSYTYDANSNPIEITDAKGNISKSEYDARNLQVKTIDPLGNITSYEYDSLSRLTKMTDPEGNSTLYIYDAVSRLIATTNAAGETYNFGYDSVGNHTTLADPNGITTTFEYNFLNQMVKEINPISMTWEYHFDPAGNLVMKVDGKWQYIRYEYDEANRLVQTQYPDGKTIDYQYDANSNQIKLVDWNGIYTNTYDKLNRLTSSTDYKGRQLSYSYDDANNMTRLTYPDGKDVNYGYDDRYQMSTMTDPAGLVTNYTYDPLGLLDSQTLPNNTQTDFDYDSTGRMTTMDNSGPGSSNIAKFEFAHDATGNRTEMIATRFGAAAVTYNYEYDDIYQLTDVTSTNGQDVSYDYDSVGNRELYAGTPEPTPTLTKTLTISTSYEYNDIYALIQAGDAHYSYDDNGNRVQVIRPISETVYAGTGLSGTLHTEYTFDVENRLVEVRDIISYATFISPTNIYSNATLMEADYSYDGMGRRNAKLVQKYDLAGTVYESLLREYVYNGLNVVAEYEYRNGAVDANVTQYYYGNGAKLTLERTPHAGTVQKYWFVYDALGTTAALVNVAGVIVSEFRHNEYGELILGDHLLTHYLFTGQEYDAETGMMHFFARYYEAETGVWLSQDSERGNPMAPATWHRYMYVLNNPINMVDQFGYWPSWADDLYNKGKEYGSKVINTVTEKVIKPAVEKAKDVGQAINEKVIKPVVNRVNEVKEAVNKHVVQPVARKVKQVANHVNENYVQPTIDKGKEVYQNARQVVSDVNEWVQENKEAITTGLDILQTGLDIVGMIPVIGEAADLINAGIYLARGDYVNAALSGLAAIPLLGNFATGAKFANKGLKLAKGGMKLFDKAGDFRKIAAKGQDLLSIFGKT